MNHIRFMTTNKTVCEKPDNLGSDFIVVDYGPGEISCQPCLALTMAHNKKQYEYDLMINLPQKPGMFEESDTRPSKQFFAGLLVGCIYMLIMGVGFFALFGK